MNEDMDAILLNVLDKSRVQHVRYGVLPSPPDAKFPAGRNLFINCLYYPSMLNQEATWTLEAVHSDTITILRCLIEEQALQGVESVCLSFLVPTGERLSNDYLLLRRIYHYSILSSALDGTPETVTEKFLFSNRHFSQGSDVPEIAALIAVAH